MIENHTQPNIIKDKGFWLTRLLQCFMIVAAGLIFLPTLWSVFFLLFSGWLDILGATIITTLFGTFKIYPRSFITAIMIAIVIAARSATWGSVSMRFTAISATVMIVVVDLVLRFLNWLYPENMLALGLGNEVFILNFLSWIIATLIFWLLLHFSGLTERYPPSERARLHDAFKAMVVFALFGPVLSSIFTLYHDTGDMLVFLAARGTVDGRVSTAALIMTTLMTFMVVRRLRRQGMISWIWLFAVIISTTLGFWLLKNIIIWLLEYLALLTPGSLNNKLLYPAAYISTACSLTAIGGFILWLMGVSFQTKSFSSKLAPDPLVFKGNTLKFAATIVVAVFIISPPLWQSTTILWRSSLFGLPPASYFTANISLAYLQAGLLFSIPLAFIAMIKNSVSFTDFFIAGLIACAVGSFFPSSYLGISFGFFYDVLGWGMLTMTPSMIVSWYILSCLPQIRQL